MIIKMSLSDNKQLTSLNEYVDRIVDDTNIIVFSQDVNTDHIELDIDPKMGRVFVDRIIEDYMTLGFEVESEFDFNELVVYTSDNELNHYFLCQRVNINQSQFDPLSDMLADCMNLAKDSNEKMNLIDTLCVYNGTYKMRKILAVMIESLESNGMFVLEDINKIVTETVH